MVMSNGNNLDLKQTLRDCPLKLSDKATFTRLSGPSTHDVYRVEDGPNRYAVKRFFVEPYTQLNRAAVFNAQKVLARQGIAPMPLWFDAYLGVWVETFEDAYFTVPSDEKDKAKLLGKILGVLHQISAAESALPNMDLPQQWSRYLEHISIYEQKAWRAEVDQAILDYNDFFDKEPRVICHNDLCLHHVLCIQKPMIVDWEYAALGSRYFDIASAVYINQIPRQHLELLCEIYAEHAHKNAKDVLLGVKQMKHSVRITHVLWHEAKSALPLSSHTYNATSR